MMKNFAFFSAAWLITEFLILFLGAITLGQFFCAYLKNFNYFYTLQNNMKSEG